MRYRKRKGRPTQSDSAPKRSGPPLTHTFPLVGKESMGGGGPRWNALSTSRPVRPKANGPAVRGGNSSYEEPRPAGLSQTSYEEFPPRTISGSETAFVRKSGRQGARAAQRRPAAEAAG